MLQLATPARGRLESSLRHLRFAIRTLAHNRTYLFAMAVLAVAIGMSTAVFSLAHAVLFRPLPFPSQDSLRILWKSDLKSNVPFVELAYPELRDLQENVPAFESVAVMPTTVYGYGKVIQFGNHEPVQLESAPVSHDFFRTLGVKPMLGRDFTDADEHLDAPPVVILTYAVWRANFNGDRKIIGRHVAVNGVGTAIVGVMAPEVEFPRGAGVWVPLGVTPLAGNRHATYLQAVARVKPGYPDTQVSAQVNALFENRARDFPGIYKPTQQAVITSLPEYWLGSARPQLLISLAASFLLVLTGLIAAGNLFLSRILARRQEIATRSSLGASTAQIAAQFIAEGIAAASIAGAAGLAIAWTLVRLFAALAPSDIPRLTDAHVSWQVIAFAAVLSVFATLACSISPAFIARRVNLDTELRAGGPRLTGTHRGFRLQNAFTVAQIALTVVLLTASLLVVVSVRAMLRADTGFHHPDAVTMNLALRGPQWTLSQRRLFYFQLLQRLRDSPSVISAGAVLVRPLEGTIGWDMNYQSEFDAVQKPDQGRLANFETITPGYFQAVGTPLVEGRDFTELDKADTEPVVIVSRSVAQHIRRTGHAPLGTRLRVGNLSDETWRTIIGVAADTRYRGVASHDEDVYLNYLQTGIPINYLVVRSHAAPEQVVALARRQVAALDPAQAIANVATIQQLVQNDTARQRFNMALLLTFGISALLLAAAGVYSIVAERVAARTREIAIRLALGSGRPALVRNFAGSMMRLVILGECLGLAASLAGGRFVESLLYKISPSEPAILATVTVFLLLVSAAAAFIPAWLAAGQEPQSILR